MTNPQKALLIILTLALAGGGALFYRMVDQMAAMTALMGRMADDVASMSRDIGAMNGEFRAVRGEVAALRGSVEKMEGHMARMDKTFGQSARQLEQVNPMQMMDGAFPNRR